MNFLQLITQAAYGTQVLWQALTQGRPNSRNILTKETDVFIENILAEWNTPGGVAVAVVRKNDQGIWEVETKGYGRANLRGDKVTEDTRFPIGSNSKLFTAIAVGLLVHNETLSPRLSWNSKIASVVPSWDLMDPIATKQATILDLLGHRTGLPRHDGGPKASDNTLDVLKFHKPSTEFRDVYQYNNNMYIVLSCLPTLLLEPRVSFARYVKNNIFDPLGMNSTTYSFAVSNSTGQLVEGMVRKGVNISDNPFGDGTAVSFPANWVLGGGEDGDVISGNGGIISTARDMAVWLQTPLLGGVHPGTNKSVIPLEAVERVAAGITIENDRAPFPESSPTVYGGGQACGTYQGHEMMEHNGLVPGINTLVARLPFDNLGVAVFSNDHIYGGFITEIIKYRLMDEALGLKKIDWNSRYKSRVKPPPDVAKRPDKPSPPPMEFTALAGMYDNSGYGKLELCLVSQNIISSSNSCQALLADAPRILPGVVEPGVPTFLAEFRSLGMAYIRISHYNGNTFNVTGLNNLVTGDPAEPYWVFNHPPEGGIYAEFAVNGHDVGFGFRGIWGAGKGVPSPQGDTVHERAEVWFEKL